MEMDSAKERRRISKLHALSADLAISVHSVLAKDGAGQMAE